jgi:hypothetical protein
MWQAEKDVAAREVEHGREHLMLRRRLTAHDLGKTIEYVKEQMVIHEVRPRTG